MTKIIGRRYDNGEPVQITIAADRIAAVDPITPNCLLSELPWVAPGLFDLQINGHGGVWFCKADLTSDDVARTLEPHFRFGITRLFPTLITASHEALKAGFTAIRQACEQHEWVNDVVAGCHLEGPFISKEDGPRGAHPLVQVRPATWGEFEILQAAAGGRIRLVTLAPECEGAIEFTKRAVGAGLTIAIGHTAATPEQVQDAVNAGARLSTHLGNGAHGQIRRHPNYIWEQLGDSRLMPSIITDGHHLPPSVIRSIIRTKGKANVVITCDAAGLAGCPPGRYTVESGDVEILESGRIVMAGQTQILAGSSLETDSCIAHAMDVAGLTLSEAFDMAGRNPCRLLGLEEVRLRRGSRADLVLFDFDGAGKPLRFRATLSRGVVRFGEVNSAT